MTIKKVAISLCLLIKTECKWTKQSNHKKNKKKTYILAAYKRLTTKQDTQPESEEIEKDNPCK